MNKTMKYIISVVFGLTLLFAASQTASAVEYDTSVAKYGTSKEIRFTSETLYYRNDAESTESEIANWNAKYDPENNTLHLRNYKGGKIRLIGRTETAQPKLQLSGTNEIYVGAAEVSDIGLEISSSQYFEYITSQNSGTLDIKLEHTAEKNESMYGILFYANEALIINGSAQVNISVINPTKATLTAMSGIYSPASNPDVRVEGNASLNVSMSYPGKVGVQGSAGIYTNLIADTTGKVSVDTSACYGIRAVYRCIDAKHAKYLVAKSASAGNIASTISRLKSGEGYTVRFYSDNGSSVYTYAEGTKYKLIVRCNYNNSFIDYYVAGETVRLEPVKDYRAVSGMQFVRWLGGETLEITGGTYDKPFYFTMPEKEVQLKECYTFPFTVEAGIHGTVKINGVKTTTGIAAEGDTVKIEVEPDNGYKVTGWTSSSGYASLPKYEEGASGFSFKKNTMIKFKITVEVGARDYAINYKSDYNFEWKNNAAKKEYSSYTYGTEKELPTADEVSRNGYRLEGWYKDWSYTDGPYSVVEAGTLEDVTFYAKWALDAENAFYPIQTYANAGGKVSVSCKEAKAGSTVSFKLTPNKGYEINTAFIPQVSYYCNQNYDTKQLTPAKLDVTRGYVRYKFQMPNAYVSNKGPTKIFIRAFNVSEGTDAFKVATYNITYDANGGEERLDFKWLPKTYTYFDDDIMLITGQNYSNFIMRDGYDFAGWCLKADCSDEPRFTLETGTMTGDVTFYAKWKKTVYNLKVYANSEIYNEETACGKIELSQTSANIDNEITVTVVPKHGYNIKKVYAYTSEWSFRELSETYAGSGTYRFTMPGDNVSVYVYFGEGISLNVTSEKNLLFAEARIYSNSALGKASGIIALYDEAGKLLKAKSEELNISAGTNITVTDIDVSGFADEKIRVKYFILESKSIMPLFLCGEYVLIRE